MLAGPAIARIDKTTIYGQMNTLNEAKVSALNFYQSSKKIYTVYLRPKDPRQVSFKYRGYTDLSQLGKYFTITIKNKNSAKTRMYTMVNFLQRRTIKLV